MKAFLRKFLPYAPIALLVLIAYRSWLFSGAPLVDGDWLYHSKDGMDTVRLAYFHLWAVDGKFGRLLLDIGQAPTYAMYGVLSKYLDLSYGYVERVVHFWPILLFGIFGTYELMRITFRNTAARVIGVCVFAFNSYALDLQTGHITLAAAYALLPLCLAFYIRAVDERRADFAVVAGLLSSLLGAYEPRGLMLLAGMLICYAIFKLLVIDRASWTRVKADAPYAAAPFGLVILLNFYWLFGLARLDQLTSNKILDRNLFGDQYWSLLHTLTLHHPWFALDGMHVFVTQAIPVYAWAIPILAFLGLWLGRKNPRIVFFGFIALLGVFLAKQADYPFKAVYPWLFKHVPGWSAFREASKFYFLSAAGYAVLIASAVEALWDWAGTKRRPLLVASVATIGVAWLFLVNLTPLLTGEMQTLFVGHQPAPDQVRLEAFLQADPKFSRTLWIPNASTWAYYSSLHPKLAAKSLLDAYKDQVPGANDSDLTDDEKLYALFRSSFAERLLDDASIKYVIIYPPSDATLDPKVMASVLDKDGYLKKVDAGTQDAIVYENAGSKPHLTLTDPSASATSTSVAYTQLSSTRYAVHLQGVRASKRLDFSEAYDPGWKLRAGSFNWAASFFSKTYFLPDAEHTQSDLQLNSYLIDPTGICAHKGACHPDPAGGEDIDLTLYFAPQANIDAGLAVSIGALIGCFGYLAYAWRRKKKRP